MPDLAPPTTLVATEQLASLDGTVKPLAETLIPVADEGFIRGDGAFEVIRVYEGRPFALGEHLDRLERSAANLRLDLPVPRSQLQNEAAELLYARGGAAFDGCLRIVLTRGGRRLFVTEPMTEIPERTRLCFVTYAPTRVLDGVKSLSYAGNMLCSRLARERGFDEALMVTPHGRVLEAPTSSFFWVGRDGVLCTPPLDEHILASITRMRLLGLIDVQERPASTEDVLEASEAFLCSSAREVGPVGAIEGHELPLEGPLTAAAAAALRAHIAAELR